MYKLIYVTRKRSLSILKNDIDMGLEYFTFRILIQTEKSCPRCFVGEVRAGKFLTVDQGKKYVIFK